MNVGSVVYICGEPKSIENFPKKFYAQCDKVVTTNRRTEHHDILYKQFLPWHIGLFKNQEKYDLNYFLKADFSKSKTKNICGITSNKAMIAGHILWKKFLQNAVYYFHGELDLYGRDINDFDSKIDFLPQYKYQIVIENCSEADYWTEKMRLSILKK